MSNKKLRAVVIGNSKYAFSVHIPFLRNSKDIDLIAIAPSRVGSTTSIAVIDKEIAYDDYNRMLSDVQPDLAVISSAPGTHFEQILAAQRVGAHVLVDKAMVCSKQQAIKVVEFAKAKELLLGVAVQRRYDKSSLYMRDIINKHEIGDIKFAKGFYCRWFPPFEHTWRNKPKAAWGGITADSGYHLIDNLLWILNLSPISVHAEFLNVNLDVEDISSLNIRLENNAVISILCSYVPPQNFIREEISIFGNDGALLFQRNVDSFSKSRQSALFHLNLQGYQQPLEDIETVSDREAPIRNFINAVLGREDLLATGESSLGTISLIDAAYLSAKTGQVTRISND